MSSYAPTIEFGEFGELEAEGGYGEFEGEIARAPRIRSTRRRTVQLASELLEINNEAELEQFLGRLISKVGQGRRKLHQVAGRPGARRHPARASRRRPCPWWAALWVRWSRPESARRLAASSARWPAACSSSSWSRMPQEQAEFEVAKRVVGLTARGSQHARPRFRRGQALSPHQVARAAVAEAARDYAPGLYRQMAQRAGSGRRPYPRPGWPPSRVPARQVPAQAMVPPGPGGRVAAAASRAADTAAISGTSCPRNRRTAAGVRAGTILRGDAGFRATTGRWVRRGRRIVLLGI